MGAFLDRARGLELHSASAGCGLPGRGTGSGLAGQRLPNRRDGCRRLDAGMLRRLPRGQARRPPASCEICVQAKAACATAVVRTQRSLAACSSNHDPAAAAHAAVADRRGRVSNATVAFHRFDFVRSIRPLFRTGVCYFDFWRTGNRYFEGTRLVLRGSVSSRRPGVAGMEGCSSHAPAGSRFGRIRLR